MSSDLTSWSHSVTRSWWDFITVFLCRFIFLILCNNTSLLTHAPDLFLPLGPLSSGTCSRGSEASFKAKTSITLEASQINFGNTNWPTWAQQFCSFLWFFKYKAKSNASHKEACWGCVLILCPHQAPSIMESHFFFTILLYDNNAAKPEITQPSPILKKLHGTFCHHHTPNMQQQCDLQMNLLQPSRDWKVNTMLFPWCLQKTFCWWQQATPLK